MTCGSLPDTSDMASFETNVRGLVGWDIRVSLENEDGTRLDSLFFKIFILLSSPPSTPSPWYNPPPRFFSFFLHKNPERQKLPATPEILFVLVISQIGCVHGDLVNTADPLAHSVAYYALRFSTRSITHKTAGHLSSFLPPSTTHLPFQEPYFSQPAMGGDNKGRSSPRVVCCAIPILKAAGKVLIVSSRKRSDHWVCK